MRLFHSLLVIVAVSLGGLSLPSPSIAGYTKDTCPREQPKNRVRADLVIDLETGKILIDRKGDTAFHPASLSKLMSLLLIFDEMRAHRLRPGETVTLVRTGGQYDGRTSSLRQMTVDEAIAGIANASLNNVLDGLVAKLGGSAFIARMNDTARRIGMDKSFFVNPTGWPTPQSMQLQRTTLHDMARLARTLWLRYPDEVARYTGRKDVAIAGLKEPLKSTNNLLETSEAAHAQPYAGVIGGKTGYTCYSGWHLLAVYKDEATGRRMVAMTAGHATGKARDDHMVRLLDDGRARLAAFARKEAQRRAAQKEAGPGLRKKVSGSASSR